MLKYWIILYKLGEYIYSNKMNYYSQCIIHEEQYRKLHWPMQSYTCNFGNKCHLHRKDLRTKWSLSYNITIHGSTQINHLIWLPVLRIYARTIVWKSTTLGSLYPAIHAASTCPGNAPRRHTALLSTNGEGELSQTTIE